MVARGQSQEANVNSPNDDSQKLRVAFCLCTIQPNGDHLTDSWIPSILLRKSNSDRVGEPGQWVLPGGVVDTEHREGFDLAAQRLLCDQFGLPVATVTESRQDYAVHPLDAAIHYVRSDSGPAVTAYYMVALSSWEYERLAKDRELQVGSRLSSFTIHLEGQMALQNSEESLLLSRDDFVDGQVVASAVQTLRDGIQNGVLAQVFLPPVFTRRELRKVIMAADPQFTGLAAEEEERTILAEADEAEGGLHKRYRFNLRYRGSESPLYKEAQIAPKSCSGMGRRFGAFGLTVSPSYYRILKQSPSLLALPKESHPMLSRMSVGSNVAVLIASPVRRIVAIVEIIGKQVRTDSSAFPYGLPSKLLQGPCGGVRLEEIHYKQVPTLRDPAFLLTQDQLEYVDERLRAQRNLGEEEWDRMIKLYG